MIEKEDDFRPIIRILSLFLEEPNNILKPELENWQKLNNYLYTSKKYFILLPDGRISSDFHHRSFLFNLIPMRILDFLLGDKKR